jgi:hypothetical protein
MCRRYLVTARPLKNLKAVFSTWSDLKLYNQGKSSDLVMPWVARAVAEFSSEAISWVRYTQSGGPEPWNTGAEEATTLRGDNTWNRTRAQEISVCVCVCVFVCVCFTVNCNL